MALSVGLMSEEETLLEVRRMVVVVDMVWAGSGEGSRVWRQRCSECMPWTSGGGGYCVEPSLFPTSAVSPILLRVLPLWLPMIALWSAEGKGPVKNEERMEVGGRRAAGIETYLPSSHMAPHVPPGKILSLILSAMETETRCRWLVAPVVAREVRQGVSLVSHKP
jgi:hypothetical protein